MSTVWQEPRVAVRVFMLLRVELRCGNGCSTRSRDAVEGSFAVGKEDGTIAAPCTAGIVRTVADRDRFPRQRRIAGVDSLELSVACEESNKPAVRRPERHRPSIRARYWDCGGNIQRPDPDPVRILLYGHENDAPSVGRHGRARHAAESGAFGRKHAEANHRRLVGTIAKTRRFEKNKESGNDGTCDRDVTKAMLHTALGDGRDRQHFG